MLRQFTALVRPTTLRTVSARTFTTSAIRMAEGDTGAPSKTGGDDAFRKRERAQEDWAIRQREKEKLLQLKEKLKEQQAHLDQLAQHIDDLTKEDNIAGMGEGGMAYQDRPNFAKRAAPAAL